MPATAQSINISTSYRASLRERRLAREDWNPDLQKDPVTIPLPEANRRETAMNSRKETVKVIPAGPVSAKALAWDPTGHHRFSCRPDHRQVVDCRRQEL